MMKTRHYENVPSIRAWPQHQPTFTPDNEATSSISTSTITSSATASQNRKKLITNDKQINQNHLMQINNNNLTSSNYNQLNVSIFNSMLTSKSFKYFNKFFLQIYHQKKMILKSS